jgi:cytoskeleton protein RodZ
MGVVQQRSDFGARVKRAREDRGVGLREIAAATKISLSALEALEQNDISRLPGGIFSRAFVRAYALEVGLDPEETVRDFIDQFPHDSVTAGSPHVPQEDHQAIESDRRSAQTVLKLVLISLPVAGAILYFAFHGRPAVGSGSSSAVPVPTAPATTPAVERRAASARDILTTGAAPLTFEIVATRPTTMEIAVDGEIRTSRSVPAGDRFVFRAERGMIMKMSDASAVQLSINNQPAVALGARGEARTVEITRLTYGSFLASQ